MEKSYSESYKEAGVDVTAGYKSVELIKEHVRRTVIPGAMTGIGGFGGLFAPDLSGMKKPVLVSGTDGVGTKIKIAFLLDRHDTVGIDCVAMCVNDIICTGAAPLFFLDYIACGKNYPEKIAAIVKGVADGCVRSGCSLIGGETAEHPGLMPEDEYDLAGFSVGIVDEEKIVLHERVEEGDVLIGLASSGLHSNGFSLVRKVFNIDNRQVLDRYEDVLGRTLGEELLQPTRIYVRPVLEALEEAEVHSIAHVTGGGFYENLPRSFPEQFSAVIRQGSWKIPAIFDLIRREGGISEHDMYNTFNMGIGMVLFAPEAEAEKIIGIMKKHDVEASVIGHIVPGDHSVVFEEEK